jgi:lactaldehyde dehydrogenase/glycolaldehyde dehydrogenase
MKDLVAGIPRYRHFINGQWADSTGKEFLEVENPATQ